MKTETSICIKFLMLLALVNNCVSQDFDFFFFVQQWPGSICDTKRSCCFPPRGITASNFTIHGLWPNFNNGSYPSFCNDQNLFDSSQITDLVPRAEISWPSLSCAGARNKTTNQTYSDNRKFWKHEWDKHGTCSASVLDQHGYFQVSLDLKDRFDLLQILQHNGIKPNGEIYSIANITEAIKQATGLGAGITCNTDSSGNKQLKEIVFCVDKSASNFIECPILPNDVRSCKKTVEFPTFLDVIEEYPSAANQQPGVAN